MFELLQEITSTQMRPDEYKRKRSAQYKKKHNIASHNEHASHSVKGNKQPSSDVSKEVDNPGQHTKPNDVDFKPNVVVSL